MVRNIAIILAGGVGKRFNSSTTPKQLVKLSGNSIIYYAIKEFEVNPLINEIIIVGDYKHINLYKDIINQKGFKKVKKVVPGGQTRKESSYAGLVAIDREENEKINVLIHDAVRPFISQRIIGEVIEALGIYKAVDVAIPLADTLIKVTIQKTIDEIPARSEYYRGQTPQGFDLDTILKAHQLSLKEEFTSVTDDCGLVLKYSLAQVYVVEGDEANIKITYPIDIHIAEKLFQLKSVDLSTNFESQDFDFLKNKHIIIFGYSSGIGKEIYKICSRLSNRTAGYSRSNGLDIRDNNAVKAMLSNRIKQFGKIDILISTVGVMKTGRIDEISLKEITEQIDINFISQINLVKSAINCMGINSSIILFTSSSYVRGRANYATYSSSKAAIVNFVQAVSEELFEKKIKFNAICPARTNTPLRSSNFKNDPINSLLDPLDIAKITLKVTDMNYSGQIINIIKRN